MNPTYRTHWYSERHLLICPCGDADAAPALIRSYTQALSQPPLKAVLDLTPAASSLLIHLDPAEATSPEKVLHNITQRLDAAGDLAAHAPLAVIEIPFCSTTDLAPDLAFCANHAGLHTDEFLDRFCAATYEAAFVGFMPGFAYLKGLDPALHMPRLPTPRQRVPAGSIAIAGDMAGIYPFASPGGWRLIGQTPRVIFDPARTSPALIEAGSRVRFIQIDAAQFKTLVHEQEHST